MKDNRLEEQVFADDSLIADDIVKHLDAVYDMAMNTTSFENFLKAKEMFHKWRTILLFPKYDHIYTKVIDKSIEDFTRLSNKNVEAYNESKKINNVFSAQYQATPTIPNTRLIPKSPLFYSFG